jgi:hypothetical protein
VRECVSGRAIARLAGTDGTDPVTSISELGFTAARDAGRAVRLRDAPVQSLSARGFIHDTPAGGTFVLPAHDLRSSPLRPGARVSVDGVLLQLPERMHERLGTPGALYILATTLTAGDGRGGATPRRR